MIGRSLEFSELELSVPKLGPVLSKNHFHRCVEDELELRRDWGRETKKKNSAIVQVKDNKGSN